MTKINPIILCACGCGNTLLKYDKRGRPRKFLNPHRDSGPTHSCWKGGTYKTYQGYIMEWKPDHPFANNDGYVYQHRLVLEQKLGRYLTEEEQTHHINGNREDNRPDNLQLIDAHEHGFITAIEFWRKKKSVRI
jgi:hypothetical protein